MNNRVNSLIKLVRFNQTDSCKMARVKKKSQPLENFTTAICTGMYCKECIFRSSSRNELINLIE